MKPQIGKAYIYSSLAGIAVFRVVDINQATGCIYLVAECPHEYAVQTLTIKVKNKHGQLIDTTVFAWMKKENCWAVNVEWDAWKRVNGPLIEDPMTELVRLTEALGGYEAEFKK